MTTLDFLDLVEQDIQKISSFAYEDMLPEEVEIQANKAFYKWLDSFASFQPRGNRFDDTEARLNDIRTLVVRNSSLSLVSNGGVSVASFPENYLYLVGVKVVTLFECSVKKQSKIESGNNYILKSDSLVYNGNTYTKGDLIKGTTTLLLGKTDTVYMLSSYEANCRIVRNEDVDALNDTHYGRTHYKSPIVSVDKDGIKISTLDKFFIDSGKIVYIRKPAKIETDNPDQEIDLPENGAYKLAAKTVEEILKVTEQSQQKIENLKIN